MWREESTDLEQRHSSYEGRHIKAETVVDTSREHKEVTRAHVAANPRLSGVLWENVNLP